ncbi:T6SS immunity protein Tli3 family protein [Burkholderia sp. DN3021]|uniref:T6SS immunity protein Tli3 family protein n=1 Tax=Burkholderia sp. DN3021 TaxID=3410137 RepID=UPI003C7B6FA4
MSRKMMRYAVAIIALVTLMQGCAAHPPQRPVFRLGDFWSSALKELPYDSPPQVIYQIDDHRFVTLERYRDCYHGESYYNDTRAGIRKYLGRGHFENFQGRIINADPAGMNIVLPMAYPPRAFCGNGEKGCVVPFWYSTDGGKIFAAKIYMDHSFNAFEDSKDYSVFVTKDRLYVANRSADGDAYVVEYPMIPGIDLSGPYPPGVKGGSFSASKRPSVFSKLRTPSGQDRITCDASIKPTNPDAPLVP